MVLKIVLWAVILLAALAVALVVAGRIGLLRGSEPMNLGVRDGRLAPPSRTPNSVTSQAALYPDHPMREVAQIAPLALRGDAQATLAKLRDIVQAMPGARLVKSDAGYLYVQFTTPLLKFVDDAEFWIDSAAGVIQVRSASRVGRKDFGVNRQRIESIRRRLAA